MVSYDVTSEYEPSKTLTTLYHANNLCSSIPLQVCIELGLVKDGKVDVRRLVDPPATFELLYSDPLLSELFAVYKSIPLLTHPDGTTMVESSAMVFYLCDRFDLKGKLHPKLGPDASAKDIIKRSHYYQGIVYAGTEIAPILHTAYGVCYGIEHDKRDKKQLESLRSKWQTRVVRHLEHQMKDGRKFYLGDTYSAVDFTIAYYLRTAEFFELGVLDTDVEREYYERVKDIPSFKQVYDLQ